ncbi:hypothetical protein EEW87_17665 (plasmid) [Janibacter melonis]|uniref:Histidine kinase/HSP90-like ATPase domain-containing protein n=1 Tax=Janibacter melonis TaxID=262209 RepID=A0A650GES1_9MICO|nr:hypothetical protein [Janibacter melonis]QGX08833.1 hypothetical protein EEW87_17665 [Janibacter melonis]
MELILAGRTPLADAAFLGGSGSEVLTVDATALQFASPMDLAGIVAWSHWAASSAMSVTLKMPRDEHAASYLQRMDVLQHLRHLSSRVQIEGRIPSDARTDRSSSLLEVTALNRTNVDDLAERLGPLISGYYGPGNRSAGAAVFRACSEVMGNATEHGHSERGAFMAAQLYSGATTNRPRLEFAVCDTGIGILAHLRKNPTHSYLTQDQHAISRSMTAGVSGIAADNGRGHGLSDAIRHTRKFGTVDFQIRSGKGEVRVHATPHAHRQRPYDRPDQTSGTWAWLTHRA